MSNKKIVNTVPKKKHSPCKKPKQKLTVNDIAKDLEGYELIKDYKILRRYDRIKYLRKDTGRYVKGGLLVLGNLKKGYIVLESFQQNWKTCKPFRFSVTLSDVILFRKIEE